MLGSDPVFGSQCADGENFRDYLKNNQFSLSWSNKYRIALKIALFTCREYSSYGFIKFTHNLMLLK